MCGGQHNRKDPNRVSVIQDSTNPSEAKVFRAHAPPQGPCENLMCAFKLLANLQARGSNLLDAIFQVLQEQSRLEITNATERRRRSATWI